jgi:sortase A
MADISGPVIVRHNPGSNYIEPVADATGPVIVRHNPVNHFIKPGMHSHNVTRRVDRVRYAPLRKLRVLFFVIGISALGYYGYVLANQYVYQAFENWAFDQQIASGRAVSFADYLREKTPVGFLVGEKSPASEPTTAVSSRPPDVSGPARPTEGAVLGRVEIKRLNVAAMVREGADANILRMAVGHVPSTALPGEAGNFAIAAHRDTLFRALKDIKKGDLVRFQSPAATYTYQVEGTKIVKPSNIAVLRPDGGGVIPPSDNTPGDTSKLLTMITCYPFYYVGAAPKRFIVEAKLVSTDLTSPSAGAVAGNSETPGTETAAAARVNSDTATSQAKLVSPRHPRKRRGSRHKVSHAFE